jgi:hypothetical protein
MARLSAGSRVEPRWAEVMKLVSSFLEMGEYGGMGAAAALWDSVESPEQRNGYMAQVEDEVRHVTHCGYLQHYFATQWQCHLPAPRPDRRVPALRPPDRPREGPTDVPGPRRPDRPAAGGDPDLRERGCPPPLRAPER